MKSILLIVQIALLLIASRGLAAEARVHEVDVCVYGATASGVMAAVAATREGKNVILVEPTRWLGGMTGGGIDRLDWGREAAVGGSTYKFLTDGLEDFHGRMPSSSHSTYTQTTRIGHSNKIYRERFLQLIEAHGIEVIYDHRIGGVCMEGRAIKSISLDHAPVGETGVPIPEPKTKGAISIQAKVFIDTSYEGDLLAMSNTTYTWGRESREQYGESLAGVRPNLWLYEIDPYIEEGNPESDLIPHVTDWEIGPEGSADKLTMGYCFRYKFNYEGEGIAIPEPTDYAPFEFELFRRAMRDEVDIYTERSFTQLGQAEQDTFQPKGGLSRKPGFLHTNLRRALMAHSIFGIQADYPDGDWARRSEIWKFHQDFLVNFVHFLKTDPVVPQRVRERAENLRFEPGDFDKTGGWPHQLYVRQARRMVSDYVVTQNDMAAKTKPEHSVGLASYGVDDWPYATVVQDGMVALQGGEFSILYLDEGKQDGSYAIPYEAIVPRRGECTNLLVPVCVSASHIAMTSIRMEPVWMVLGESAGVAAAMAATRDIAVQDVPYAELRPKLLEIGQKLDVLPPVDAEDQ
jgi:hypothetical protein